MKCQDMYKLINLYIDNMLDEDGQKELEAHIEECEKCRTDFKELEATKKLLGSLPDEDTPPGFEKRLHNRLVEVKLESSGNNKKYTSRGILAIATALVVFVVLKIGLYNAPMEMSDDMVAEMEVAEDKGKDMDTKEELYTQGDGYGAEVIATGEDEVDIEARDMDETIKEDKKGSEEGLLTEDVAVKVQDVCANTQAIERIALMHDIEVVEIEDDSIIVEVDTLEKRRTLYEELSKLGKVENLGRDQHSGKVKITIVSE